MPADMSSILMIAAMVAIFYFLMIRPAQKKAKDQAALISQLGPGTRIMTAAGVYGTIAHVGQTQAIIEVSPGVELTIAKQAILRAVTDTEDEFEYDDDVSEAEVEPVESVDLTEVEAPVERSAERPTP